MISRTVSGLCVALCDGVSSLMANAKAADVTVAAMMNFGGIL